MTKQDYDNKVLSLKGTHDYDMLCFIRGQYIASLESQVETLTAENAQHKQNINALESDLSDCVFDATVRAIENAEQVTRIEYIEAKTEELHKAFYGHGSCNDSAEYVLDNLLIDIGKLIYNYKQLQADNQSLVAQVNAGAKQIDELTEKLKYHIAIA
jgi:chromosome segregation ATPase